MPIQIEPTTAGVQLALRIIPRDAHPISRKDISPNALRVLYRLREAGFGAYLVGGAVRDLLVGGHPKDFDVATDATPEQVKGLFRNCRLIGRRFRLAHVVYGREIIEVATFRANVDDGSGDRELHEGGRLLRDNVYGTIEDDAIRRDFTANALYYAIEDFSVRDYVGGFEDVQARVLKLIGDPEARYREDPVRMLRAVRLAAKLDFSIDPATAEPIAATRVVAVGSSTRAPVRRVAEDVPVRPRRGQFRRAGTPWPAARAAAGNCRRAGVQSQRRTAPHAAAGAAQHRCARRQRQAGVAGVPVRRAAVAGVLPRAGGAAGAGRACGRARSIAPPTASPCTRSNAVALPRRFSLPMQEIWLLQTALHAAPCASACCACWRIRVSAPRSISSSCDSPPRTSSPRTSPSGATRRRNRRTAGRSSMPTRTTAPRRTASGRGTAAAARQAPGRRRPSAE